MTDTVPRVLTEDDIYNTGQLEREFMEKHGIAGKPSITPRQYMDELGREPDPNRPPFGGLTKAEIEKIIGEVTTRVLNNFYQEVGRSVVVKVLQGIGIFALAAFLWFTGIKVKPWFS